MLHPNAYRSSRHNRPTPALLDPLAPRLLFSTYYVSPTGADSSAGTSDAAAFATLQHAANLVQAGDSVIVRPGTYSAGFVLGWDAPQSGTASAPISFLADPGTIITGRDAKTADGIDLEPGCNYVTIQGFTVNNASGSITRAGIRVTGSDHVTVRDNTADNNDTWGIFTGFANDLLIENNVASHSHTQHGIYVSNSGDRPVIRDNIIFGNNDCGIHMNGDVTQGGDGIISNALVEGNIIHDNGVGGGSGINCDGVQNSIIQDNLLYNNHASGISLFNSDSGGPSSGNVLVNNTVLVASDGRWALNVANASVNTTGFNNILYNFGSYRGGISISADSLRGFASDYNAVISRFTTDGSAVLSLSKWQSQTGQDQHSIPVSDPSTLFTSLANNDYTLAPASPAIEAGAPSLAGAPAPADDLAGNPRPSGAAFDIGAYERDLTPPALSSIAPQSIGLTSAIIQWTTNEASDSQVTFGPDLAHLTTLPLDPTLTTTHSVSLAGLLPGTVYHFHVSSRDAAGNLTTSPDQVFITVSAISPGRPLIFGDANADGLINPDDYILLDRGFAKRLTGWFNGDFNGDGIIDSKDYLLLDTAYLSANPSLAPSLLSQRATQFGAQYVTALDSAVSAFPTTPTVLSTSFANGSANVPTLPTLRLTFNTGVLPNSLTLHLTNHLGHSMATVSSYDSAAQTVSLIPLKPLHRATTYTLALCSATTSSGRLLRTPLAWSFTTASQSHLHTRALLRRHTPDIRILP